MLKKFLLPGVIVLKVALLLFFLGGEGEIKWTGSHAAEEIEEESDSRQTPIDGDYGPSNK